jgi:sodium/hydrogen antiporter
LAATLWYIIIGGVFVVMALSSSLLKRLPLSTSLLYLLIGIAIGPAGIGLLSLDLIEQAALLERLSEVVVLISLFTAGLKLRARLRDGIWRIPVRLAFIAMLLTVALIAVAGVYGMALPLGVAVLLGAILAPTDPVLASDVQVEHPTSRDRLRFGLTGEAGLNDGTAFPMVMLGLGLIGLHELGRGGWRWLAVDVVWAVCAGLLAGWLLGMIVGKLVVHLRREYREAVGLDDFLGLGLIALSYGVAHALHVYGFLAVFAAGLALRHIELDANGRELPDMADTRLVSDVEAVATAPETAPTYMAQAVLGFNEQLERIGEVAMAVALGVLLVPLLPSVPPAALWFLPLLFFVIRPVAVALSLLGSEASTIQRGLMAWFGIRGIGSLYYLSYAITHGLEGPFAEQLAALTAVAVAVSIVLHGISVTPIMKRYSREKADSSAVQPPQEIPT